MKTIYIVGEFIAKTKKGAVWQLLGIATTEAQAVASCREHTHFYAPFEVGWFDYGEPQEMTNVVYPLATYQNFKSVASDPAVTLMLGTQKPRKPGKSPKRERKGWSQ